MNNLSPENSNYLSGQVLIATPQLVGSCFEKSVIFLCSHNEKGAMGILVNRTIGRMTLSDVFVDTQIDNSCNDNILVHFGGPVELTKGFVLHSDDYNHDNTFVVGGNISVTSNIDVIKDITTGNGPDKSIVAFGYAGWSEGQLESEICSNSWINAPATNEIVFETSNDNKWKEAANTIGIDLDKYTQFSGRA
jgi:putative transcriptional regulator